MKNTNKFEGYLKWWRHGEVSVDQTTYDCSIVEQKETWGVGNGIMQRNINGFGTVIN